MKTKNLREFICSPVGKILMIAIFYALIFGLMLLAADLDFGTPTAICIAVICGYFGWKTLNRITPTMFLIMSFMGWVVYFFVKGFLSVLIGIFVAPFYISKRVVLAISERIE